MNFIHEMAESKTFKGYIKEGELQATWQIHCSNHPEHKYLARDKKKALLGNSLQGLLRYRRKLERNSTVIKLLFNEDQYFFLKRIVHDWVEESENYGGVNGCLADMVRDAKKGDITPDEVHLFIENAKRIAYSLDADLTKYFQ